MENNRKQDRKVVHKIVQWTDGVRARKGEIQDVSDKGVFLSPSWTPTENIKPGDVIEILVDGPDGPVEIQAEVRWSGSSDSNHSEGIGLQSTDGKNLAELLEIEDDKASE
ncbi:MAG: PilZ domain-containing protein [Methylococcales bacterium]|nr:PilZ domain-containing protein [Methylococcales bacterium]MBT7410416.1 PilZ domain-containing protein [Methylococcales bacterium]